MMLFIYAEMGRVIMDLDWRWLRSFVAVVESATMRDAGLSLGISQPTLSRHMKQLEDELKVTLFERTSLGLTLSDKGRSLYERALLVRDAVDGFERQAIGDAEETSGAVRVMMHCMFGYHFAPTWLHDLRQEHPQLSIDLTIDDRANLLTREVEIAIRISRPTQVELICQRVGKLRLGVYASERYFSRREMSCEINTLDDLSSHELIGFDQLTAFVDRAHGLGLAVDQDRFVARTDLWAIHPQLIQSGVGVGVIPIPIGEALGLIRVLPDLTLESEEIYLTAHPDLRRSPRVRLVWDHLCRALQAQFS